jgi:hypothetical protein
MAELENEQPSRTMILFTLASGGSIAIDQDDILRIWTSKNAGNLVIEFCSEAEIVEVVCDFDGLMEYMDRLDLRLKESTLSVIRKAQNQPGIADLESLIELRPSWRSGTETQKPAP